MNQSQNLNPPKAFLVGGKQTPPFVIPSQVQDHLTVLRLFSELRQRVENTSAEDLGLEYFPPADEKERRWSVFVGYAVERFERWCKALRPEHCEQGIALIMPPLDVFMVWHTYLLNPGWFIEDVVRIPTLKGLWEAGKALAAALGMGLGELLQTIPADEDHHIHNWEKMTATPFDPFKSLSTVIDKTIICPKCGMANRAPFLHADGTGFHQVNFTIVCQNTDHYCGFKITHDVLAMRKLLDDLLAPETRTNEPLAQSFLAGTLYTPGNTKNIAYARRVKTAILQAEFFTPRTEIDVPTTRTIMQKAKYSFAIIKSAIYTQLKTDERL
ncbi:hypothetical protein MIND_00931400 [Mycena indigotica]|uniref:Uncharacterized protein n=1 Tax=Mycena indigotica TaxID=2126181 RepID=A0A8H6SCF7_9AGAR|nr:uncharacterized protein MIND_00931400 [Mycena indigotica]KAF7296991.1 hypothetical protein MIND_00931400 [Mycena indigotica]